MAFSYVPPFKVYFTVPLDGRVARAQARLSKRIQLTKERLDVMRRQFDELALL